MENKYGKYLFMENKYGSFSKKNTPKQLPYDNSNFLGVHPKELKARSQRDICTPIFIAALFIIAKT